RGALSLWATRRHLDCGLRRCFADLHRVLRQRTRICVAMVICLSGDVVRHRIAEKSIFENRLARTGSCWGCGYVQYSYESDCDCRRVRGDVVVHARRGGGQQVQERIEKRSAVGNCHRTVVDAALRSTAYYWRSWCSDGEERRRVAAA